jgi:hypothetical protein
METEHTALLYYCEPRAKVLHVVFEMKDETIIFVSDGNNNLR